MSNFTPLVTKEYDFDSDHVTVTFSRLRRRDMLSAMPKFLQLTKLGEDDPARGELITDVLNDIADKIPEYVKSIDGLIAKDGTAVTIDTVVDDMYFMRLAMLISTDMMRESTIPGGNE